MDSQLVKQISDYFSTQPVLKAWVFGSFARNEESAESDVDLMVDLDHSHFHIGVDIPLHICFLTLSVSFVIVDH